MAEAKTSRRDDIPKPEWECEICGSKIVNYVFGRKSWRITSTYHFTGFWMQDGEMVWVGKICPNASKSYCRECGAIRPKHYPECRQLSKGANIHCALMRARYLLEREIIDKYKQRHFLIDGWSDVLLQSTKSEIQKHAPSDISKDDLDYLVKIIIHRQKEKLENWEKPEVFHYKGVMLLAEEKNFIEESINGHTGT